MKLKPRPGIDRFGASDAWLMFSLWVGANGHYGVAGFAALLCLAICVIPDEKRETSDGVEASDKPVTEA